MFFFQSRVLYLRSDISLTHENNGQDLFVDFSNNYENQKVVSLVNSINLSVNNNIFDSIKSSTSGGSLKFAAPKTNFVMKNATYFNSSSSGSGGSFYFIGLTNLLIENCSLISSSATNGGAGYISSTKTIINDCIIANSVSSSYGGALYLTGTEFTINKLSIENSTSNGNGGGIYCNAIDLYIYDSKFTNCQGKGSSSYGGAIYYTEDGQFLIKNCQFINILCRHDGGSIAIYPTGTMYVNIESISFYNCTSQNGNGGAIFLSLGSYNYKIISQIDKICASNCHVLGSASQYGHFMAIEGSINTDSVLTLSLASLYGCGDLSKGVGCVYLTKSQHRILNCNGSYLMSTRAPILYSLPTTTFVCHFNTYFNNTSSDYECMYIQGPTTIYSATIQNSNLIRNHCLASIINVTTYGSRLTIQECIFINNTGSNLIKSNVASVLVKNCYVYHLSTVGVNATYELLVTSQRNTQTHKLSHYSTVFCSTPEDMNQLEIPCQTIPPPPSMIPDLIECNTLPLPPTECILESVQGISLLSHILGILRTTFIMIMS